MDTRHVTNQYRLNKWAEIICKCRSSGMTVVDWCIENNINTKRYYYWLKKVREAACESLPAMDSANQQIVPVSISAQVGGSGTNLDESSAAIVLRIGSITMEIRNGATSTLIENTLRALNNAR